MTIVPDSRKTYDPEYKKAKESLKRYTFNTKKIISSVRNLGDRALAISKCYSKLCTKVTAWYPDSPPAVRQSLNSINKSAKNFNKMTVDDFIKMVIPNFEKIMKDYKKKTNVLLTLEKNRRTAVKAYDKNKEKLRAAQCSREPDEAKIDHLQRQVNATEETYNTLNDHYITAVNDFTEVRKTEFIYSLEKCFNDLMTYINKTTQFSVIKFPNDLNSALIVDAKTVTNHDDMSQHMSSQPILPPAASNSGMPNQMPVYVPTSNNYRYTVPNSSIQPPAPGYYGDPNQTQVNGLNLVPLPPSPLPYNYSPGNQQNGSVYDVEPQVYNRSLPDNNDDDSGKSDDDDNNNDNNNNKDNNNKNDNDENGKKNKKAKKHWKSRKSKVKKSKASKPYY
ncbi:hypothetical protein M9Y10_016740 [Tritrichomonas musculus]|uniref:BAR domain-containing protein n=1 Tax=Tritrichomonas musculus TaxID=1915356 RepID=A0ABR2HX12_9EUKA